MTKRNLTRKLTNFSIWTYIEMILLLLVVIMMFTFGKNEAIKKVNMTSYADKISITGNLKHVVESSYHIKKLSFLGVEKAEVLVREIDIVGEKNNSLKYNPTDKEILAQLMYAEEGVFLNKYEEKPEEVERVFKLAGSVAIRRMEHNYKGAESLADVVYTEGEYAFQTVQKVRQGQDVPTIVYVWAEELLVEGPIGPKGLIYQAQFEQGEVYDRIGNQIFGIDPKYN